MGNNNGQDTVSCLQATTGKVLWQTRYPAAAGDYGGPRATPTIHGGNVYTLSRDGLALCLNAVTGKQVWRRDIARETRAAVPGWGFASSPLIQGGLVLFNIGRAGVALNKTNGTIVWSSGAGTAGYASPVPFALATKQTGVAVFAGDGIMAVNPASGRILWQYPWKTSFDVNAADPIFSGDKVFISSNYGKGGALLRVGGARPSVVWESRDMRNHFNSCVLVGGALYGNDENTLKCIDLQTGAERWRMRGMGKGGLIAAGGKLLVLTERGELVVVSASPERFTEIARARVMNGTCWTHPVLSNGLLYCRSHEGDLVCLDLRSK
jgi:outer membrane protein assembly factor BamB